MCCCFTNVVGVVELIGSYFLGLRLANKFQNLALIFRLIKNDHLIHYLKNFTKLQCTMLFLKNFVQKS